jgi:hypothetical protein
MATTQTATKSDVARLEQRIRRLEEALEDRRDVEAAEKAEAEAARRSERPIPWRKARKRLE